MKRIAFPVAAALAIVSSSFACIGAADGVAPAASGGAEPGLGAPASAPPAAAEPETLELPDDPFATVLPHGAFRDVDALCERQRVMAAPRIEEAKREYEERYEGGDSSEDLAPSCEEVPRVLEAARVELGAPYLGLKAIAVETGHATATFLVVETREGWVAVRHAFLSDDHDDPGCPSSLRENGIASVRASGGTLVVLTTADRATFEDGDLAGQLILTHARACRLGDWGPTCGDAEVVAAKTTSRPLHDPDAPDVERETFATGFRVTDDGAIVPDERYEDGER